MKSRVIKDGVIEWRLSCIAAEDERDRLADVIEDIRSEVAYSGSECAEEIRDILAAIERKPAKPAKTAVELAAEEAQKVLLLLLRA